MIERIVIPAAGLGSRLFPITTVIPKELLPIIGKPMIQFSIEESLNSGIYRIAIIIRKDKIAIKQYLSTATNDNGASISYINQIKPEGLGDAVLKSENWTGGETFGVLLPDDIIVDTEPIIKKLAYLHENLGSSVIAVEEVVDVNKYGIINGKEISDNLFLIDNVVEKPPILNAPSHIGIVGRYILTPEIFSALNKVKSNESKNIELTDALQLLLNKEDIYAYKIQGRRYDCGYYEGYLKAIIDFALKKSKSEAKKDG